MWQHCLPNINHVTLSVAEKLLHQGNQTLFVLFLHFLRDACYMVYKVGNSVSHSSSLSAACAALPSMFDTSALKRFDSNRKEVSSPLLCSHVKALQCQTVSMTSPDNLWPPSF